ncbi:MAG TPA: hypothetical protein VGM59_07810, partial [Dongiaceae bacterium]
SAPLAPAQISPAELARVVSAPIAVSPRVEGIYREKYLAQLDAQTSGAFAISPNGNRFDYRTCRHPDCQLSDDELAVRAIGRCSLGAPQPCVLFDRNGRIGQPNRIWTDADFDEPNPMPPALTIAGSAALAPGKYNAMTPDGVLVISLRPPLNGEPGGRAYFWDTGDGFHQGTWSLREDGLCIDSVDQQAAVACGKLYGTDAQHITGATLDLFPTKFLPVTRLPDAQSGSAM